jgi:hypothetical protein
MTVNSSLSYSVDLSLISNPQDLYVGFLDSKSTGSSFDSLEFSISGNIQTLFDRTFNNVKEAKAFFNDDVLDLSSLTSIVGTDPYLNLFFNFTLVGSKNSGFDFNFVFYDPSPLASTITVPLPPSVFLLGSGLLGLGLLGWRRKQG